MFRVFWSPAGRCGATRPKLHEEPPQEDDEQPRDGGGLPNTQIDEPYAGGAVAVAAPGAVAASYPFAVADGAADEIKGRPFYPPIAATESYRNPRAVRPAALSPRRSHCHTSAPLPHSIFVSLTKKKKRRQCSN